MKDSGDKGDKTGCLVNLAPSEVDKGNGSAGATCRFNPALALALCFAFASACGAFVQVKTQGCDSARDTPAIQAIDARTRSRVRIEEGGDIVGKGKGHDCARLKLPKQQLMVKALSRDRART